MKKLIYLIIAITVLGLIVAGCGIPVVPPTEQNESGVLPTKALGDPGEVWNQNTNIEYPTIQAAIDAASPGNIIEVGEGTYQENLATWKDMEITKSLSLIGAGSGSTIVELSSDSKMNGVEIRGSALDVTIQGITFTKRSGNTYATSFPLRIAETLSTFTKLTLIDVEVAYAKATNVLLGGKGTFDEVYIENCNFHDAGAWGFMSGGTINKITVKNSDFEYNGQVDLGHGNGFDLTGPVSTNVLVEGGSFSNNTQAGINLMQVSDATFRDLIANDNCGNPGGGFGIKLDEWGGKSQNILFENCTATGNTLDGITIQPEKADAIENVRIVDSTLSDNGRNGLNLCYINNGSNNPEMHDVSISCSTITGNGSYGVRVYSWWVLMPITEIFDATCNWWGDKSGPGGEGTGNGDAVSSNVDYSPWLGGMIESIEISPNPAAQGTPTELIATFTGPTETTATINWGDGTTVTASSSNGTVTGSHTYAEVGVYTVVVTLATTCTCDSSDPVEFQYAVVYDPSAGFVTGGGWIDSPAGASTQYPDAVGKASFGFVSKYKKGQSTPTGNTEFQFKAGDLNFHSDTYDWLVIAGAKAKYKGTGTINGAGNFGFMLSAVDEELTPSTDVDLFRIKIWDKDDGDAVVYDNNKEETDDADPTTEIGGGQIVIHKGK